MYWPAMSRWHTPQVDYWTLDALNEDCLALSSLRTSLATCRTAFNNEVKKATALELLNPWIVLMSGLKYFFTVITERFDDQGACYGQRIKALSRSLISIVQLNLQIILVCGRGHLILLEVNGKALVEKCVRKFETDISCLDITPLSTSQQSANLAGE